MKRTTEQRTDPTRLSYYPPASGPQARDGNGKILVSRRGNPVIVRATAEVSWSCPDCGKNLGRSAVAVKSHFATNCL